MHYKYGHIENFVSVVSKIRENAEYKYFSKEVNG